VLTYYLVNTVQAYLILAIRELMIWSNVKAYMYAGTALRMAQALYLNVEARQRYSPRQKEIRRRTFWACFVVDRLISYSCNKPFTLSFQSAQIQLPCPDNIFAFDEAYTGLLVKELPLHSNQVSQLGIMPFFIAAVQLWGDMALLHVSGGRRRSKYGPHVPEGKFYQYRKAIEDFSASLPPSLSWSSQNYKLHQITGQAQAYVNLNFLLHHSKCVMHQEYLPQLDSQYSLGSEIEYTTTYDAAGISLDHGDDTIIKLCMYSVNTITDMALTLNAGSDKDQALLQSIFAANAILTASAVHLWVLYTQTCDACPKHEALAKAEKLRQVIKSWLPQWRVATAWVETLEMLYKLYVYSYGKVVESDLDCWDMGTDEINDRPEVSGEAIDESGGHPIISDADNVLEPSVAYQRLYDKIRSILVNPLLATDVKKRNLRYFSRTLWQHMWIFGPTEGFGEEFFSLENITDQPASALFNMPPLDMSLESI
jgi:Fungal specific transcription factor domain